MRNVLISHPYPPKEKRWAFHCMFSLLNHPTYPPLKVTSRSDLLKHRYLKQLGDGKPPFLPRKIPWERGNPPRPLNPNKNKHSKGGGLVENRDGNVDHGFACVFFFGGGTVSSLTMPNFSYLRDVNSISRYKFSIDAWCSDAFFKRKRGKKKHLQYQAWSNAVAKVDSSITICHHSFWSSSAMFYPNFT